MNALIDGFPLDWQKQAILNSNLSIKYWITYFDRNFKDKYEDIFLHNATDAIYGRESYDQSQNERFLLYKNNSFYDRNSGLINVVEKLLRLRKYQYLKFRKDIYKSDESLRRFVFKEIAFWDLILDQHKIEVVVLEATPHMHFAYIIYYLAKLKNLKIMIFNRASDGVLMRFFLAESMENLTPMNQNAGSSYDASPNRDSGPPIYSDYGKDNPWNQKIYWTLVFKGLLKLFHSPIKFITGFHQRAFLFIELLKVSIIRTSYKISYKWLATSKIPTEKFIYLPMHVRPEDSSYPVGGDFEDIYYCAEYLLDRLDDNIVIAMREHPNQRYLDGNMYRGYYKNLLKLGNIVLLDMSVNSDDIIDQCELVATTTGQTGWEAILKNKPAILFSHPWYEKCPYAYSIDDIDLMEFILNKPHIDSKKVDEYYNQYLASTSPGSTNLVVAHALGISMEENIQSISSSINLKLDEWGIDKYIDQ